MTARTKPLYWLMFMLLISSPVACDDGGGDAGAPMCGNGMKEGTEECDGDDLPDTECTEFGFLSGQVSCTQDCRLDFSRCVAPGCGNNTVDGTEECDGQDLVGKNCTDFGYYGGALACSPDCTFDFSGCQNVGRCGDGVVQEDMGEECDGTDFGGKTCQTFGYNGGSLTCGSDCRIDWTLSTCPQTGKCGDGILQPEYEDCEGSNMGEHTTCAELYPNGGEGLLTCGDDCHYDTSQCGWCGDGYVQTDEECDGTNLAGHDCTEFGYYTGTLACTSMCELDTSGCEGSCGDGTYQYEHEACDGTTMGEFTGTCVPCMEAAMFDVKAAQDPSTMDRFTTAMVDGTTGDLYIAGITQGRLFGAHGAYYDLFVARYDHDGRLVWGIQVPSTDSLDSVTRIMWDPAAPGSRLLLMANVKPQPPHFLRLTTDGTLTADTSHAHPEPALIQGKDGVLYTAGAWLEESSNEWVVSWSSLDSSSLQVTAHHEITDLTGSDRIWLDGFDVDSAGNVYFLFHTYGSLPGHSPGGLLDAYVMAYTSDGSRLWVTQLATDGNDIGHGLEVGPNGILYVAMQFWSYQRIVAISTTDGSEVSHRDVGIEPHSSANVVLTVLPNGNVLEAHASLDASGFLEPLEYSILDSQLNDTGTSYSFPAPGTGFGVNGVTMHGTRVWLWGTVEGSPPGYEPYPSTQSALDAFVMFHDVR